MPTMIHTLLLVDAVINLVLGLSLILYPPALIRLLGIPDIRPGFYARVLGGVLFGIGLALSIEAFAGVDGLGIAGAAAINLCGGAAVAGALMGQDLPIPIRGRVVLWGLVTVLAGLSLVELGSL